MSAKYERNTSTTGEYLLFIRQFNCTILHQCICVDSAIIGSTVLAVGYTTQAARSLRIQSKKSTDRWAYNSRSDCCSIVSSSPEGAVVTWYATICIRRCESDAWDELCINNGLTDDHRIQAAGKTRTPTLVHHHYREIGLNAVRWSMAVPTTSYLQRLRPGSA